MDGMRLDRELRHLDLYVLLGVAPSATREELRRAYRRKVLATHPDLERAEPHEAERRMAALNVAAGVLLDPERRAAYDRLRGEPHGARRVAVSAPFGGARSGGARSGGALFGGGGDGEWSEPLRARAWARAVPEARELLWRLRPWPARAAERLSSAIAAWSPRRHAAVMAVSVVMAAGLIAEARPVLLVQLFTPAPASYASSR